jgi:catechol 2,3-dioxygenase-like lactoylglutathione lyase family enzyme
MVGAIHHGTLRVGDVDEALGRWSRLLGLTGEREGEGALLRCAYEDFCLELRPAGDAAPGLEHVAYELRPGVSLDEAAARLPGAREVAVPRRGRGLRLEDPDGNGVVVVERVEPASDEERWPPVARFTQALPPFHPRKLGHANYLTADVRRIVDWYVETLGFRVTDWIGDEGCWLHVNADHHVLAFLDKGVEHVHHLAFELVDWGEFRVALDHLGQHGRWLTWGPGRHAMAQNLFAYWRMFEEDLFVELYADMEQLREGHRPRHFPDDPHASNVWGTLPPRSYFRFDAEAIRSEREQLAALQG